MTWYPQDYVSKVPMTNMAMRAGRGYPGRTYRFYKGPVVFPFGHGLSYTTFAHTLVQAPTSVSVPLTSLSATTNSTILSSAVRVSHTNCNLLSRGVHVDVKNTGTRDGTHTLLVFSSPPSGKWAASKQLVGFHKIHIVAGSKKRVKIDVHVCKHLSIVDQFGIRRIPMGQHKIQIGDLEHHISIEANIGDTRS
jgi:hypothetical protein